jgi:hypothetical protein
MGLIMAQSLKPYTTYKEAEHNDDAIFIWQLGQTSFTLLTFSSVFLVSSEKDIPFKSFQSPKMWTFWQVPQILIKGSGSF